MGVPRRDATTSAIPEATRRDATDTMPTRPGKAGPWPAAAGTHLPERAYDHPGLEQHAPRKPSHGRSIEPPTSDHRALSRERYTRGGRRTRAPVRMAPRPKMPLGDLIRDLRDESELWDALSTDDDEADAVRTVFAWSYRALTAQAARLFRLLGLHPGPDFGVAAAAALVGDTPSRTRRQLDVLVGAHLVEQVGQDRFRFHDLLRAYALDQAQAEETAASRADLVRTLLEW